MNDLPSPGSAQSSLRTKQSDVRAMLLFLFGGLIVGVISLLLILVGLGPSEAEYQLPVSLVAVALIACQIVGCLIFAFRRVRASRHQQRTP